MIDGSEIYGVVAGKPVTVEQYWRTQAHNYGLSPDDWSKAYSLAQELRSQAGDPIKGTVTYGDELPISRRQHLGDTAQLAGIDPRLLEGMTSSDPSGKVFSNQYGKFYPAYRDSDGNMQPARFVGVDLDGNPLSYTGKSISERAAEQQSVWSKYGLQMPGSASLSADGTPGPGFSSGGSGGGGGGGYTPNERFNPFNPGQRSSSPMAGGSAPGVPGSFQGQTGGLDIYPEYPTPPGYEGIPGNPLPIPPGQQPGQFKPYGEPVSNFSQQRSYGGLPRSVGPWGQMGGYYAKTQGVPTLPSVAPQSGGTRELFPLKNISGQFSSPMP